MIGRWRIIVVKSLPFVDQRLNGKIPKVKSQDAIVNYASLLILKKLGTYGICFYGVYLCKLSLLFV
jgi:hypothetical protein